MFVNEADRILLSMAREEMGKENPRGSQYKYLDERVRRTNKKLNEKELRINEIIQEFEKRKKTFPVSRDDHVTANELEAFVQMHRRAKWPSEKATDAVGPMARHLIASYKRWRQ